METENTSLGERTEVLSRAGLFAVFKGSHTMSLCFDWDPEVEVEVERIDGDGTFQLSDKTASRLNRGIDGVSATYSAGETVRIKSVYFGVPAFDAGGNESLEWDDYIAGGRPRQITKRTILSRHSPRRTGDGNGSYTGKGENK